MLQWKCKEKFRDCEFRDLLIETPAYVMPLKHSPKSEAQEERHGQGRGLGSDRSSKVGSIRFQRKSCGC